MIKPKDIQWLRDAEKLAAQGNVDSALDVIYNNLYRLQHDAKRYEFVNQILELPCLLQLQSDLLLGVITITRNYGQHLPSRKALCLRAREVFLQRGEDADALMANLNVPLDLPEHEIMAIVTHDSTLPKP